jgi:hypothetical protein
MALYTPNPGASVSGVSYSNPQGPAAIERFVYDLLCLLEEEENNLPKIAGRTDQITINVNLSKKIAAIELLLNVVAANAEGGITTYAATHFLTGSSFTSGTGGSGAPNLAQAAMEGVVALKLLELEPARKLNPDKTVITRCTHTLGASGGSNATFNALLDYPIEVIRIPGGGSVIEGKVYLNG